MMNKHNIYTIMKQGITATALALLLLAASCVREITSTTTGTPVTVTARVGQTRAGGFDDLENEGATDTDGKDYYIATLRLLVFRAGGGALLYNYPFNLEESDELYFELTTNTLYDIAVIANETSDQSLSATLHALPPSSTLASLDNLAFASTAIGTAKPLPMTRLFRDVMVIPAGEYPDPYTPTGVAGKSAGKITYSGGPEYDPTSTSWEVTLPRLATRVELRLVLADQSMVTDFLGISLQNVPNKVYLFNPAAADGTTPRYNIITGAPGELEATPRNIAKAAGSITDGTGDEAGRKIWTAPRLILPSCEFSPATKEEYAIKLVARFTAGGNHETSIGPTLTGGFTAPRNALFNFTGIVNTEISVSVTMQGWNAASLDLPLDGPGASPYIAIYHNGSLTLPAVLSTCEKYGKKVDPSNTSYVIARPSWVNPISEFYVIMHHRLEEDFYLWPLSNFSWDGGLLKLTGTHVEKGDRTGDYTLPSGKYVILCEREP
jgi:hypothetical protein